MPSVSNRQVLEALRPVIDPELGISIVDLGLVYSVHASDDGVVRVWHTLTAPGCPLGQTISNGILRAISKLPGVTDVEALVVFDPPWNPTMVNEAGRRVLRLQ